MRSQPTIPFPTLLLAAAGAAAAMLAPGSAFAANPEARATLSEWSVSVSAEHAHAGEVTFHIRNDGDYTHAFEIDHNGERVASSQQIPPGGSATVTAELGAGKYEIFCPIDGHKARGMDTTVSLSDSGMRTGASGGSQSGATGGGSSGGSYSY